MDSYRNLGTTGVLLLVQAVVGIICAVVGGNNGVFVTSFTASTTTTLAATGGQRRYHRQQQQQQQQQLTAQSRLFMATVESSNNDSSASSDSSSESEPPAAPLMNPMLNGKRILPVKIVVGGLKGSSNVAAVYAVLNSKYSSSSKSSSSSNNQDSSSWTSFCEHIGTTTDLEQALNDHTAQYNKSGNNQEGEEGDADVDVERVSFVRAISFATPNMGAMESIASDWKREVVLGNSGGRTNFDPVVAAMDMDDVFDDDSDDDDDDDDDYFEMMAGAMSASRSSLADARGIDPNANADASLPKPDEVVSPFEQYSSTAEPGSITFNKDNVDKVLEEIRPYLISDGGNVSVDRVVEESQDVYLVLEGACGSCPSSTVTMQMGIERVLKENFPNLGQVLRVEDDAESGSGGENSEFDIVQGEVNRIKPAIVAMGGKVEVVTVDKDSGIVKVNFEGASRVRQGLELALLDIDFVETVEFE